VLVKFRTFARDFSEDTARPKGQFNDEQFEFCNEITLATSCMASL
jgi:hypothetical protein